MACGVVNTQGTDVAGWCMTNPHDNIRVGSITLVYSTLRRGWLAPGGLVIRTPLTAQRMVGLLK
ncbi:DUF1317 family protein, partial [Citrobacter sp. VF227]